jgi:ligand-binding sensor domain-containing protein
VVVALDRYSRARQVVERERVDRVDVEVLSALIVAADHALVLVARGRGDLARPEALVERASGLPSENATCVVEGHGDDGSQAFWISTDGGVVRYERGHLQSFGTRSGLTSLMMWHLVESRTADGASTLWIASFGGVIRLEQGSWISFDTTTGFGDRSVVALLETKADDGSEAILAGTASGTLSRLADGKCTDVPLPQQLRGAMISALLETPASGGGRALWVASYQGGVARAL